MHTGSITRNHRGDIKKTKETLRKKKEKKKTTKKTLKPIIPRIGR